MSREPCGLWAHPAFLKLWAGQAASLLGSRVGGFAFDLTAVLTLHASPTQMAVLNGCLFIPSVVTAPVAGLWADRLHRRPLLITADLGRAITLLVIPLAAIVHALSILELDIVALLTSTLGVLFDVSYRAYLPTLIGAERIAEANSKLQGTAAVTEAAGWSVAGLLVQTFTAPLVVGIDAVSFLGSALSLLSLADEAPPGPRMGPERWWYDLRIGLSVIRQDPMLIALAATAFTWDFISSIVGVVILLFFVHDLHLTPALLGPLTGIGGISALGGALVAGRVLRRYGPMRTLIGSLYLDNLGLLAIALAGGPLALVVLLMALGQATDAGRAIYEIHSLSFLQSRVPEHLAGRVNATFTTLSGAATALGLVAGSMLGQEVGLRSTLMLALCGNMLVPIWLLRYSRSPRADIARVADNSA